MERTRLIVNFDSSCDKLLSTENVIACGETFDILFRDVTLSGTVRVAFWDYETLLWRSEGSASQGDGGSILEGLVADTKELADVFRGGSGFFAARMTVGEQVGGDEWRDYGVAYVRLYRGTDPSENPPPAESVAAELREAITAEQAARKEADETLRAAIDAHAGRTDNPHEVTAEQVPYGEAEARNATLAGADNWNGAWGFDLDIKTLDAAAWEGVDPETVVKVSEICLRVSERDYTGDLVWLELTGTDGKVWVSQDEPSWLTRGAEVPYRFEPAAELPGGVIAARFVVTNGLGNGHAMPLRVSKVSTTETPAGCDVWTADKGTSKRTDFAPCVVRLDYSFPATVAVA